MANTKGTYIEINKDLLATIKEYCELNGLKLTPFINELLQREFMVEKYGEAPSVFQKTKPQPNITEERSEIVEETEETTVEQENKTPKIKKKVKTY